MFETYLFCFLSLKTLFLWIRFNIFVDDCHVPILLYNTLLPKIHMPLITLDFKSIAECEVLTEQK